MLPESLLSMDQWAGVLKNINQIPVGENLHESTLLLFQLLRSGFQFNPEQEETAQNLIQNK